MGKPLMRNLIQCQAWWCTPVIPATQDSDTGGWQVIGQPGPHFQKNETKKLDLSKFWKDKCLSKDTCYLIIKQIIISE
jgi:hypothetical protein